MARSVMRLGPVHVVVVVPSAALRGSLVAWLRVNKRVRLLRAVASAADLGPHQLDCDLVIASALEGPRELRALGRRFGKQAGLVALSLGASTLPRQWAPVRPGAMRDDVLDHARPHPERAIANTSTLLASVAIAVAAFVLSVLYVPAASVSFQRAALAYAARWPDTGTWWHIYGAGGPYLATASWPLLKLATITGGGQEMFILLAGTVAAMFGVAMVMLALRLGMRFGSVAIALAAVVPPALWLWPRTGDVSSLVGLTGVVLAIAGSNIGRLRFPTTALGVMASSFGGILWVLAAALVTAAMGVRDRTRVRAALAGALFGVFGSFAVTVPPLLSRGIAGFEPPLARPLAVSDLVPVIATAALVAVMLGRGRARLAVTPLAAVVLVGANVLALQVPTPELNVQRVRSTGAFGRLAVHPGQALSYAAAEPDLPTTGGEVTGEMMLGGDTKEATNARLEWLAADRAALPDRSSAVIFNERDWQLVDRDKLLFSAPSVRPILTAGITPTLLVVADEPDAAVLGDALVRLGVTSERVVPVRARRTLDELYQDGHADRETLRDFTMLVVYGQPWKDVAKAAAVLDDYLALSGFVFMDSAARAGKLPLLGEAKTVKATAEETSVAGDEALVLDRGFEGRAVAIEPFLYRGDKAWEQAALSAGNQRVIQYGSSKIAGDVGVSAHLVWSGADLPARAARGDEKAQAQFENALAWMLSDADLTPTTGYGRPAGDTLESDIATATFVSPTHWRIELKVATTGILFKERYHDQWRAFQVDVSPVTHQESRTPLKGLQPTTHGYMYVTLPPNARVIDFVFEKHPLEAAARGVSGVAVLIIAAVTAIILRRKRT